VSLVEDDDFMFGKKGTTTGNMQTVDVKIDNDYVSCRGGVTGFFSKAIITDGAFLFSRALVTAD
jgi:hypothetical protein